MDVLFNIDKLNKTDRKIYEAMTDTEKQSYEKTWILIEENKIRLQQKKNASKERVAREKKALAEKDRKERVHRLIERGAILESCIDNPLDFTNNEIQMIIEKAIRSDYIKTYIEEIRNKHFNITN